MRKNSFAHFFPLKLHRIENERYQWDIWFVITRQAKVKTDPYMAIIDYHAIILLKHYLLGYLRFFPFGKFVHANSLQVATPLPSTCRKKQAVCSQQCCICVLVTSSVASEES